MKKVFIDGSAGTTGLRIVERLSERGDLELLRIPEELRKDKEARKERMNCADVVFLCLPDDAAREAVTLIENENTTVIDTSTAHRVSEGWAYGFPEIGDCREHILESRRIANPGCHASGFIVLVAPLVQAGLILPQEKLSAFSLTGYSGGGKKMIAQYENTDSDQQRDPFYDSPRMYGISQMHKHLPEMKKICGLESAPVFAPIVADFYSGMEVTVLLHRDQVKGSLSDIREVYRNYYASGLVHFVPDASEGGFLASNAFSGRDDMQITVCGNEDRMLLVSRFDNLGKGASGAAIQNMNLILGVPETEGLNV